MRVSLVSAPLVAVIAGFGGTLAVVVAAARNLGADDATVVSWVWALCLGVGLSSVGLSVWHRMPVVTAWSLAGAVLMAALPGGMSLADATGAFLFAAVLMLLAGAVPALGAVVGRIPASIGGAMLAGLVLRLVGAMFVSVEAAPLLVLPLLLLFLIARAVHAASAPLVVIAAGLPLAGWLGYALPAVTFGLATPVWVTPRFEPQAMIGLGLPLFLVTMATQQIPGAAVLVVAGYRPPMRSALLVSGGLSLLLAPFGGYSVNLSSVTAAICTGPDVHPDPARRWPGGVVYGLAYGVLALFGAGFATMLGGLPPVLVATVAGTALLGPLAGALAASMRVERERIAAATTFSVTASGVTLLGLGGAFWGLAAGLIVLGVEAAARHVRPGLHGPTGRV